jgi:DNA polymerase III subunit gamma/tau
MGKALYRVYRPKKLADVVGQEHITRTLEQALKQGRISHAYLFTGPRGVGKTSVARILAHEINDLPYTDDSAHLDIIEIDAASNRRIDEIRELRERVAVAPTSAKYKVYIIDEVHMLTREAFNALLKTLEEPPAHVVFILATTDAHKLPETIISRTQRFSFKPGDKTQIVTLLKQISQEEKINVDAAALSLIAEHGEGSFRDSTSLLDQAGSQGQVTLQAVQALLGLPSDESIGQLLQAVTSTDMQPAELMKALAALYDQGFQAAAIAKRLGALLRTGLAEGTADTEISLKLLQGLIEVPAAYDPDGYLELLLLQNRPRTDQPVIIAPTDEIIPAKTGPEPPKTTETLPKPSVAKSSKTIKPLDKTTWTEALQTLKQRHNTLYGVVRMAEPDFSEAGRLQLSFAFAFHQKRLNENANREKIAAIVEELTGQVVKVEGIYDQSAKPTPVPAASADLTAISNIFGNAELLES